MEKSEITSQIKKHLDQQNYKYIHDDIDTIYNDYINFLKINNNNNNDKKTFLCYFLSLNFSDDFYLMINDIIDSDEFILHKIYLIKNNLLNTFILDILSNLSKLDIFEENLNFNGDMTVFDWNEIKNKSYIIIRHSLFSGGFFIPNSIVK